MCGLTGEAFNLSVGGLKSRWVHDKINMLIIIICLVIFHVCFRSDKCQKVKVQELRIK